MDPRVKTIAMLCSSTKQSIKKKEIWNFEKNELEKWWKVYLWTKFGAMVTNNNRFLKKSTAVYSKNAEVEIYRAGDFVTAWGPRKSQRWPSWPAGTPIGDRGTQRWPPSGEIDTAKAKGHLRRLPPTSYSGLKMFPQFGVEFCRAVTSGVRAV